MTLTTFVMANSGWTEIDLIQCQLANGVVMRATSGGRDIVGPDGFLYSSGLYGKWSRGGTTTELSATTQCAVTINVDTTVMLPGTSTPMLWVSKLFARAQVTITTCTIDLAVPTVIIGSVIVFVGRCTAPGQTSTSLILNCWDETYVLAEPWPRRVICAGCPFTLFDAQCRLNRDDFAMQCVIGSGSTQTSLALLNPNTLAQSNGFNLAPWVLTNATATAHGAIAPDGTNTAFVLQRVATNGTEASVTQICGAFSAGVNLNHSVHVKAGSAGALLALRIIYADATAPTGVVTFNPATGAIVFTGTTFTGNASITPLPNGWYRCSIHAAAISSPAAQRVDIDCTTSTIGGLGGAAGDFIYIWGAQLENNTVATTYCTTTTLANQLSSIGNNALPYSRGYIVPTSGQAKGWPIGVTLQTDSSHIQLQPFPLPLVPGDSFTLYPGCDGTKAVCQFTYNNLSNGGHFPSVPGPASAVNATGA